MSKVWLVTGSSRGLAQEIAPFGVKVTVLEPGAMRTDWGGASMTIPQPACCTSRRSERSPRRCAPSLVVSRGTLGASPKWCETSPAATIHPCVCCSAPMPCLWRLEAAQELAANDEAWLGIGGRTSSGAISALSGDGVAALGPRFRQQSRQPRRRHALAGEVSAERATCPWDHQVAHRRLHPPECGRYRSHVRPSGGGGETSCARATSLEPPTGRVSPRADIRWFARLHGEGAHGSHGREPPVR